MHFLVQTADVFSLYNVVYFQNATTTPYCVYLITLCGTHFAISLQPLSVPGEHDSNFSVFCYDDQHL